MPNHETDGDISDGISVISDCESNRHSPMPIKMTSKIACDEDTNERETNVPFRFKDFSTLVNKWDQLSMERKAQIRLIISSVPLILLAAAAAILLYSKMCSLDQQIEGLKNENLVLKVKVSRLVELHRVGHDHFRSHGSVETPLQILKESVMKFSQELKKKFNEIAQKY